MVPNQFGPPGQMVPRIEYSVSPGEQAVGIGKYGDQISWGPFVQMDQILGTICLWGLFVQWDQLYGDHLSSGTASGRPEVRGPNESQPSCRHNNCLCFGRYDIRGLLQSYSLAYFFLRIGLMHLQAGIRDKYPLSPYVPPGLRARWCAPVK